VRRSTPDACSETWSHPNLHGDELKRMLPKFYGWISRIDEDDDLSDADRPPARISGGTPAGDLLYQGPIGIATFVGMLLVGAAIGARNPWLKVLFSTAVLIDVVWIVRRWRRPGAWWR
jgi:hypothetical protein